MNIAGTIIAAGLATERVEMLNEESGVDCAFRKKLQNIRKTDSKWYFISFPLGYLKLINLPACTLIKLSLL
jgi:hypothetical protein